VSPALCTIFRSSCRSNLVTLAIRAFKETRRLQPHNIRLAWQTLSPPHLRPRDRPRFVGSTFLSLCYLDSWLRPGYATSLMQGDLMSEVPWSLQFERKSLHSCDAGVGHWILIKSTVNGLVLEFTSWMMIFRFGVLGCRIRFAFSIRTAFVFLLPLCSHRRVRS